MIFDCICKDVSKQSGCDYQEAIENLSATTYPLTFV